MSQVESCFGLHGHFQSFRLSYSAQKPDLSNSEYLKQNVCVPFYHCMKLMRKEGKHCVSTYFWHTYLLRANESFLVTPNCMLQITFILPFWKNVHKFSMCTYRGFSSYANFIATIFITAIFQNIPEIFGWCIFWANYFITAIFML